MNKQSERTLGEQSDALGLTPSDILTFAHTFGLVQKAIHDIAVEKGWWGENGNDDRNFGEVIALITSELSEALEAARAGNPPDDKIPQYSGIEAELADAIIRILDFSERMGYNIAAVIVAKAAFNKGRKNKHGGKKF